MKPPPDDPNGIAGEPALADAPAAGVARAERAAWLAARWDSAPRSPRLGRCLLLALAAGPFAAVCALLREPSVPTLLTIAGAPVAEELAKAAAALMVLEKKPWFFPGTATLVALCAFSGFVFAGIENALYLFVYIDDPSPGIVLWRLTVCTSLHVVCAAVSGFGLARAWRRAARERDMARLSPATPFLVAAILVHALYNLAATFLSIR